MSFPRHTQIYQSDASFVSGWWRSRLRLRPRSHRLDEFAASYSLAGCTPALPASASPAGSIFNLPAETVNLHRRRVGDFSTGRMGNFQLELTEDEIPSTEYHERVVSRQSLPHRSARGVPQTKSHGPTRGCNNPIEV